MTAGVAGCCWLPPGAAAPVAQGTRRPLTVHNTTMSSVSLSTWLGTQLEAALGSDDASEDMAEYILAMEDDDDVLEYLAQLPGVSRAERAEETEHVDRQTVLTVLAAPNARSAVLSPAH
jgi:hypothetical protein